MTVESSRNISLSGRGCALVLISKGRGPDPVVHRPNDIDRGGLCPARTWQGVIYVVFIPL